MVTQSTGWRLALTVPGSRRRERLLKRHGGMTRYCPICTPTPRTPPGEPE